MNKTVSENLGVLGHYVQDVWMSANKGGTVRLRTNSSPQVGRRANITTLAETEGVKHILYNLEVCFAHGLKPENSRKLKTPFAVFWLILEALRDQGCKSVSKMTLNSIRSLTSSQLGRSRIFLRMAFSSRDLLHCVEDITSSKKILEKFYDDTALLRVNDSASSFMDMIRTLNTLSFSINAKDSDVDKKEYWAKKERSFVKKTIPASKRRTHKYREVTPKAYGLIPKLQPVARRRSEAEAPKKVKQNEPKVEIKVEKKPDPQPRKVTPQPEKPLLQILPLQTPAQKKQARIELAAYVKTMPGTLAAYGRPYLPNLAAILQSENEMSRTRSRSISCPTLFIYKNKKENIKPPPSAKRMKQLQRRARLTMTLPALGDMSEAELRQFQQALPAFQQSIQKKRRKRPKSAKLTKSRSSGFKKNNKDADEKKGLSASDFVNFEDGWDSDISSDYDTSEIEHTSKYKVEIGGRIFERPWWIDDRAVTSCGYCCKRFHLIRRRHHCRKCGSIFCKKCVEKIPIPELGYPQDQKEWVCIGCQLLQISSF